MNKERKGDTTRLIVYIVIAIIAILLGIVWVKTIWGSNLPEWLKVFLCL